MRIRKPTTGHTYPDNVVRILRPQFIRTMLVVKHHFKNRHINGAGPVRSWADELKRMDASSGYSTALRDSTK